MFAMDSFNRRKYLFSFNVFLNFLCCLFYSTGKIIFEIVKLSKIYVFYFTILFYSFHNNFKRFIYFINFIITLKGLPMKKK